MKKTTMILMALGLAFAVSCQNNKTAEQAVAAAPEAAQPVETVKAEDGVAYSHEIVYIQMDVIYAKYGKAVDLSAALEKKVNNTQAVVERRGKKLENEMKTFQDKIQKGLITRSVAEMEGQKLQQKEAEFNQYAGKKQQELQEETMVTTNQINDAIYTFIQKYNAEKGYAMILTNQGGVPVMTANPALDITEDVVAGLNAEYQAEQAKQAK